MNQRIGRLTAHVRALLTPRAPGRHSRAHLAARPAAPAAPPAVLAEPYEPEEPEEPFTVRPYVLVHEERRQQRQRRRALVLATVGIDLGARWIHGMEVAR